MADDTVYYESYFAKRFQEIQQSMVNVAKDLENIQSTMDKLREQQQMLFYELNYHKAATARLPDDVLREIFIMCARTCGRVSLPLNKYEWHMVPQMALSQVCMTWRRVAFSTGRLWSNISISYPWVGNALKSIETWLQRAGRSAVSLKLVVTVRNSKFFADFQRLLCPVRITHLDLMIPLELLVMLSDLPDDALPDMEEVRLTVTHFVNLTSPKLPSFVRHARFFHCSSIGYQPSNSMVRDLVLPWSQIRYFDIWKIEISASQCFDLLNQMVSLEICRVHIKEGKTNELDAYKWQKLTLCNLKFLVIEARPATFQRLASLIAAPQLRKLTLQGHLGYGPEIVPIIATRFNLHGLEELTVDQSGGDEKHSADVWLREATSLRSVRFPGAVKLDKGIMSELGTGRLGCCLETMELADVSSVKDVLDMARSRLKNSKKKCRDGCQKVTPLKRIKLTSRMKRERFADKIDELKQLGVEIVMNEDSTSHYRAIPANKWPLVYP
ncbi:hypothetical protein AX17_003936 [Amanita inopinata Kibby_2008]|nr:hypothetical protein AX17_003936 [Amanita inopinata Kibby_2008]